MSCACGVVSLLADAPPCFRYPLRQTLRYLSAKEPNGFRLLIRLDQVRPPAPLPLRYSLRTDRDEPQRCAVAIAFLLLLVVYPGNTPGLARSPCFVG